MSVIYAHAAAMWRAMRRDYQDVLEAQYAAAEDACGYLVNRRGLAAGWTGFAVFTANPVVQAAYASRELLDHLAEHPRTTLAAYEAAWLDTHLEAS